MYKVILYYNFKHIDNAERFCSEHKKKCQVLNLKGRVYIAAEGINGTLAGTREAIKQYKDFLWSQNGFQDTEFKDDECRTIPFDKLIVKTRPEIVTLKTSIPLDPAQEKAPYLEPHEWRKVLEAEKDYVILDVRNDYESDIGYFEGAIRPDVENFYNFPQWLDRAPIDKNKKVLMYCTGGIRCEKFSILMKKKGFENIFQLHGGIINYAQKEGGAHFKGKCFVFDDRLAVVVNPNDFQPVGRCAITGVACDTYINCSNMDCNHLFICSKEGAVKMQGCCSDACLKAQKKRPFNVDDIYAPSRKWYRYFKDKSEIGKF